LSAKHKAQEIAFAPVVFQTVRVLRDSGILQAVEASRKEGITVDEIVEITGISRYGVKVLLDAGLSVGVVYLTGPQPAEDSVDPYKTMRYRLGKTGHFILNDTMTIANMDFTHDVCYQGLFHLDEAIANEEPSGLKVFGQWPTIYEALKDLPEGVRESWFGFDHYYSDGCFPHTLKIVLKDRPKTLLDVGGNTGKWALKCVAHDDQVQVTIADLPGQLKDAAGNAKEHGVSDRISGFPINLLDDEQALPEGFDVIWMSQFLDCFSEEEVVSILRRAAAAMDRQTRLFIMDTYWDRQRYETSAYCLNMTSIYFTALANGNSRMYHSKDMIRLLQSAGLAVIEDIDDVGLAHTIFQCIKV
jgi:hypothetical protein